MAGMSLSKCSGPSLVRAPNGPTKTEPKKRRSCYARSYSSMELANRRYLAIYLGGYIKPRVGRFGFGPRKASLCLPVDLKALAG
mgnify:CR=1 FL=1